MTGSATSSTAFSGSCCWCEVLAKSNAEFASAQRLVREPTGVAAEFLPGTTVPTFVVTVALWPFAFGAPSSQQYAIYPFTVWPVDGVRSRFRASRASPLMTETGAAAATRAADPAKLAAAIPNQASAQ